VQNLPLGLDRVKMMSERTQRQNKALPPMMSSHVLAVKSEKWEVKTHAPAAYLTN